MTVFEAISKRYSCRQYTDRTIEANKLSRVLEAARLAPSAKNLQDWRFVVVTDKAVRLKVAEAANRQMFLADAAAIIVGCSNNSEQMRCGQAVGPIDVAIALEHIALQAVEEGLGTCWIGSFYPEQVREILQIPQDIAIIELMSLGYPADTPVSHRRMDMDKIVCYDKWQL